MVQKNVVPKHLGMKKKTLTEKMGAQEKTWLKTKVG
jgi:hypothetical protein